MNIGLYFGSFNPIHIGHLIIANHVANNTDLNEIWFVVSPHNPLKKANTLLNEHHRFELVQLALQDSEKLKASNIEFKLPKPSYTADTLQYLSEKYPKNKFTIIIGSDSYQNIEKWKNYIYIINNYNILIFQRPLNIIETSLPENIQIINAPLLEISSTLIRKNIKEKKSIKYLVTDSVMNKIIQENYYGSTLENPA